MKLVILSLTLVLLVGCGTGIKNLNLQTKDGQKLGCVDTGKNTELCTVDDGKGNLIELEIANDPAKSK
jgi:hypothetical protein